MRLRTCCTKNHHLVSGLFSFYGSFAVVQNLTHCMLQNDNTCMDKGWFNFSQIYVHLQNTLGFSAVGIFLVWVVSIALIVASLCMVDGCQLFLQSCTLSHPCNYSTFADNLKQTVVTCGLFWYSWLETNCIRKPDFKRIINIWGSVSKAACSRVGTWWNSVWWPLFAQVCAQGYLGNWLLYTLRTASKALLNAKVALFPGLAASSDYHLALFPSPTQLYIACSSKNLEKAWNNYLSCETSTGEREGREDLIELR